MADVVGHTAIAASILITSVFCQVRIRAQDLQKTISQAIFDLETAPERYDWCATCNATSHEQSRPIRLSTSMTAGLLTYLSWYIFRPNVLERFAVMNSQLHSITSQMVPLMEHYIVHPRVIPHLFA